MKRTITIFILTLLLLAPTLWAQDNYLYIGSYTSNKDGSRTGSEGIYIYKFNSETGKLDSVGSTAGTVESPAYLAVSHNGKFLYAGTDTRTAGQGSVSAFVIDSSTGSLTFLNKVPSGGDNPLFVDVLKNNNSLAVANYGGGSFAIFKLKPDGSIDHRESFEQLYGKGTHPSRQEQSHPHAAVFVPKTPVLLVTDFGTDKILIYDHHFSIMPLCLRDGVDTSSNTVPPGSGPRHVAFHPEGKYIYIIEELSGSVAVMDFAFMRLSLIQRIPTHPAGAQGPFESADIHLSPDGKFLYASNRGQENNIAIFKVDKKSGKLIPVGYQSTLGVTPRNFAIDPSGNFLLVANQSTGNVVVFRRDKKTGLLTHTGASINIPQVSCLKFLKL